MAKRYKSELSINDIRALAWNATENNQMAIDILTEQNRKMAKIANRRLASLEKEKLDMFAYDRAITYLRNTGTERFPMEIDTNSFESMVNQLSELKTFIDAKTSTVPGARKMLNAKLDKISQFTGTDYTEEQRSTLGRLLGTDSVSTLLREVRGDSGEVLEALEELSLHDVNTKDILSIIDKHLLGYTPWSASPWSTNFAGLNYDEMLDELEKLYENPEG